MMAISSSNTRLLATALSSRFFAPAYSALACRRHSTITGIASPYTCSSPGPGSWVTNSRCSLHAGLHHRLLDRRQSRFCPVPSVLPGLRLRQPSHPLGLLLPQSLDLSRDCCPNLFEAASELPLQLLQPPLQGIVALPLPRRRRACPRL